MQWEPKLNYLIYTVTLRYAEFYLISVHFKLEKLGNN